jgi:hypothetical protein
MKVFEALWIIINKYIDVWIIWDHNESDYLNIIMYQ